MAHIGRKIYYDKATGNVIQDCGEREGSVIETTLEQDFAFYVSLSERVPETVGVVKLEYGQYAQDFKECNAYCINPNTFLIEFSYPDPNTTDLQEPIYQKPLSTQIAELEVKTDNAIIELTLLIAGGMM